MLYYTCKQNRLSPDVTKAISYTAPRVLQWTFPTSMDESLVVGKSIPPNVSLLETYV